MAIDPITGEETEDTAAPIEPPQEAAPSPPLNETEQMAVDSSQDTEEPLPPEKNYIDSSAALTLATKAFDMPYKEGADYLTSLYKNTNWSDPETAAQAIATTSRNYREYNLIAPEADLNTDAAWVTQRIMDKNLTEEQKIAYIEDWSEKSKRALYTDVKDPTDLLSAREKEDRIDDYTRELRRGVVAGDISKPRDMIARGIEAAISPLAGTADAVFGTDIKSDAEAVFANQTNPKMDKDFSSKLAATVGFMGGAVASSFTGPVGAYSYLGAALVDQSKSVYDTVLSTTKDPEIAKDAMLKSLPGNVVGMFADRFIGKGFVSAIAKKPTALGAISGALAGAGGGVIQTLGTGAAITSATKTDAMPTLEDTAESALVGGIVGGAFGGVADIAGKTKEGILARKTLFKSPKAKNVEEYTSPEDTLAGEEGILGTVIPKFGQKVKKGEAPPVTDKARFRDEEAISAKDTFVKEVTKPFIGSEEGAKKYESAHVTANNTIQTVSGVPKLESNWQGTGFDLVGHVFKDPSYKTDLYLTKPDTDNPNYDVVYGTLQISNGNIKHIVISPKFRKQGLATKLLEYARDTLKLTPALESKNVEEGAARLYWDVFKKPKETPLKESSEEATYSSVKDAEAAGIRVINPPKEEFMPTPMLTEIVRNFGMALNILPWEKMSPPGKLIFGWFQRMTEGPGSTAERAALAGGAKPSIAIRQTLFKDPEHALRTIRHEIGHAFDYMRSIRTNHPELFGEDTITGKLLDGYDRAEATYKEILNNMPAIEAQALEITKLERPGFDNNIEYRSNPKEIFADVFGAFMRDPQFVKEKAPELYDAIYKSFTADPILARKMYQSEKIMKDQSGVEFLNYQERLRERARLRTGEIYAGRQRAELVTAAIEKAKAPKKSWAALSTMLVNKFHLPRVIVDSIIAGSEKMAQKLSDTTGKVVTKEQIINKAEGLYNKLYKFVDSHNSIHVQIDKRLENTFTKLPEIGLKEDIRQGITPMGTLKTYMMANHVMNETTAGLERIAQDRNGYIAAVDLLVKEYPTSEHLIKINETLKNLISKKSPEDLIAIEEELAKIQSPSGSWSESHQIEARANLLKLLKETQALNVKDPLTESEKSTPREDYIRAIDEKDIVNAIDLLDPATFSVRRYMAHPDMTGKSARRTMKALEAREGAENFKKLANLSEEIHQVLSEPLLKAMIESDKYSPELIRKISLNKSSYITTNVLKYFEMSPIRASTKEAKGTLDIVGDELTSTIMKTKAFLIDAYRQTMENALVNIGQMGGIPNEILPYKGSIYTARENLQNAHPENSYFIATEKGVAHLIKMESPELHKAMDASTLMKSPVSKPFIQAIDAFNKLTLARELKTIFSAPFLVASKFYDTANEAILARVWEIPGLPMHVNSMLKGIKAKARTHAEDYLNGRITTEIRNWLDKGGLTYNTGASHGKDSFEAQPIEEALMELSGIEIPKDSDFSRVSRYNQKAIKLVEKIPFTKTIRRTAERDELATKIAAYFIARDMRGLTEEQSIRVMREWAGTPDPLGGGVEAVAFNKIFLFGRAHINGMRQFVNQVKDDPAGYSMQYAYRKMIPRLMVSSALMSPLVGALFGEEEGKIVRKYLDKISSYKKMSSLLLPLGMTDETGKFRNWGTFGSEDIGRDWKSATIAIPMSREMVVMDQLYSPLIGTLEELADTGTISLKQIGNRVANSLKAVTAGGFSPGVQVPYQMGQLLLGYNPTDFYRNKGILPQDVDKAGNFVEKFYTYAAWSLYNNAPGLFSAANIQKMADAESPVDYLTAIPQVGGIFNRFINITNYGDMEKDQELAQEKLAFDASVRSEMGSETHKLLREYSKMSAMASSLGKSWKEGEPSDYIGRAHQLRLWHTRVYTKIKNDMAEALQKGDSGELEELSKELEERSTAMLSSLKKR